MTGFEKRRRISSVTEHNSKMRTITFGLFACLALGCECFAPTLNQIPRSRKLSAVSQTRPLRIAPKATLSADYYSLMATATNLLLAVDSDESKVDRLYNGIPATGAVEVCNICLQKIGEGFSLFLLICHLMLRSSNFTVTYPKTLTGSGMGSPRVCDWNFTDPRDRHPPPPQAGRGRFQRSAK